jgi:RND family efflux transporter MFP subunit
MSVVQTFGKLSLLFLPVLALAAAGCDEKHPQPVATPPPAVDVSRPLERTVTDHQVFTARTQAVESVDLKARVTGYLTKILFKDGDEVKKDQVLFQIDDRPYKATLDQAKATLEFSRAALVKAQAEYDIGLAVQKQDRGAISEQDITRRLGARDESKASVAQAKAALEMAQLNYDWCKVTTPISGRTTRHLIDAGNVVTQNVSTLVNIVSLKPIWAYVNVDQTTAGRVQALVREGKLQSFRAGEIPVDMAVGVGSDERFPIVGAIDYVSNQLDPNTGSLQVRATFPNKDEAVVAGLFARIRVPISAAHPALLVTDRAVGTDQGQKFVLVVNDKDEVEYRAVDVGQLHDGLREVLRFRTITEPGPAGKDATRQVEVLKPTDRVIVDGLQRVRPGDKVEPKLVDMLTLLPVGSSSEQKGTPPAAAE